MKEREIIHLIKAGYIDERIRTIATYDSLDHIGSFCKRYETRLRADASVQEAFQQGIADAGFISAKGWQKHKHEELYQAKADGITLSACWQGSEYCHATLQLTMPDGGRWFLFKEQALGNIQPRLRHFIKHWHQNREEQQNFEQMLRKAHKKLEVGTATLKSLLRSVAQESGFTYGLLQDGLDTILHVKLRHSRSIVIKLKPDMDMRNLADLFGKIRRAAEAMDALGSLQVNIKTGNLPGEFWKQAGGAGNAES